MRKACACVIVVGVLAGCGGGGGGTGHPLAQSSAPRTHVLTATAPPVAAPPSAPQHYSKTARIDPLLAQRVAVFRRPARRSDRVPLGVRRNILDGATQGDNPALARRVLRQDVRDGFLVPTARGTCFYFGSGSGGCAKTSDFLAGRLTLASSCDVTPSGRAAFRIFGFVPDGIRTVTILSRTRPIRVLHVNDNAYAVAIPKSSQWQLPFRAQLGGGGAPIRVDLPVDRAMLTERC